MTATVFWDNANELATLTGTWTVAGAPADPTTVSLVVTDPSGTQTTYTTGSGITKVSVGVYTANVSCTLDGLWSFVWIGTGTASDVQPGTWRVLPLTVNQWYCGAEELKDRLSVTDTADDFAVQFAIQTASRWIEGYCGRHFYRIQDTRTYEPDNIWVQDIDDLATTTGLQVAIDRNGTGVYSETWTLGTDYVVRRGDRLFNVSDTGEQRPWRQLQVVGGSKWFPFVWPWRKLDAVQVTGTFGWPAVPAAVSQACQQVAADLFKLKDAPFGVMGVSDLGIVRAQQNPWVTEMLRPYVNGRRKVGV